MQSFEILSLENLCPLIVHQVIQSWPAYAWQIIVALWPIYWILITLALIGWIVFEIFTRHGTFHYNSENGFSPSFNRFVGAVTYTGLQALLFMFFHWIFGDIAYCWKWPWGLHALIFFSTGLILHLSGFWPYLVEPGVSRRKRKHY